MCQAGLVLDTWHIQTKDSQEGELLCLFTVIQPTFKYFFVLFYYVIFLKSQQQKKKRKKEKQ